MNIQEYKAREIFKLYGIPAKNFGLARNPDEALQIAKEFQFPVVVKAQVLVGGRGKAGGIKLASSPSEVFEKAKDILGMNIKGIKVKKVLVAEAVDIVDEYYVSISLDRSKKVPVVIFSESGGVDIEEVAKVSPDKIFRFAIDPFYGLMPFAARAFALKVLDNPKQALMLMDILLKLYRIYVDYYANLVEINPLAIDRDGNFWAADAKIVIDDNGLSMKPELECLRDLEEEDPAEIRAKNGGLSYVKLDGNIGCVVNGAGLAMATADLIQYFNGKPANFLDVGGSSDPAKMRLALEIITDDPNVNVVLVNIFGGITRCDDIALGIKKALDELQPNIPFVVRLKGTRENEAKMILKPYELSIFDDMEDAIREAVRLSSELGRKK